MAVSRNLLLYSSAQQPSFDSTSMEHIAQQVERYSEAALVDILFLPFCGVLPDGSQKFTLCLWDLRTNPFKLYEFRDPRNVQYWSKYRDANFNQILRLLLRNCAVCTMKRRYCNLRLQSDPQTGRTFVLVEALTRITNIITERSLHRHCLASRPDLIKRLVRRKWCFTCHQIMEPTRKCAGCEMQYYCNRKCQKQDWIRHRSQCLNV